MLLRCEAGGARRLLAEIQKAPNFVTKSTQGLIIEQVAPLDLIISYPDLKCYCLPTIPRFCVQVLMGNPVLIAVARLALVQRKPTA